MRPDPPDLTRCRRVLIVKLSALGDVVHALPVAAALHERYPHLEIDWVAEPLAAPLLEGSPVLAQVHVAPKEKRARRFGGEVLRRFLDLVRTLRARSYDIALDLQGLTKSAVLARLSGAGFRLGYNWLRELAPLLERAVPRQPKSLHIVDQLLDVARHLGADPANVSFPMGIASSDRNSASEKLAAAGVHLDGEFWVLNPTEGGGGGHKGMTPATMAGIVDAVTRTTGIPCVMVGAQGDADRAAAVAALVSVPLHAIVGQTSVRELAAVISMAKVHVSGDSGSAHIAAAVGTPPVTVYGRSNPVRVGPYGYARYVVDARRYCSERCRRYHERTEINLPAVCLDRKAECVSRVTAEEVTQVVLRAMTDTDRGREVCS